MKKSLLHTKISFCEIINHFGCSGGREGFCLGRDLLDANKDLCYRVLKKTAADSDMKRGVHLKKYWGPGSKYTYGNEESWGQEMSPSST